MQKIKESILLIDNTLETKKIMEALLTPRFKFIVKENGKKAYAWLLDGNKPKLIIIKFTANEIHECEFIHQIRTSSYFRSIKTLLIGKEKPIQNSNNFCLADDYLKTPIKPNLLYAKIEKLTHIVLAEKQNN